jgi:hypothetical protein
VHYKAKKLNLLVATKEVAVDIRAITDNEDLSEAVKMVIFVKIYRINEFSIDSPSLVDQQKI